MIEREIRRARTSFYCYMEKYQSVGEWEAEYNRNPEQVEQYIKQDNYTKQDMRIFAQSVLLKKMQKACTQNDENSFQQSFEGVTLGTLDLNPNDKGKISTQQLANVALLNKLCADINQKPDWASKWGSKVFALRISQEIKAKANYAILKQMENNHS